MCSTADPRKQDTKVLLDNLYQIFSENEGDMCCSTCSKLILKLHGHFQKNHGQGQGPSPQESESEKRCLRTRKKRVNYSEEEQDDNFTPSLKDAKKLKNCNLRSISNVTVKTSDPQIKIEMEDLETLESNIDVQNYQKYTDEVETKIDINYMTGSGSEDSLTTTAPPDNITMSLSSKLKATLRDSMLRRVNKRCHPVLSKMEVTEEDLEKCLPYQCKCCGHRSKTINSHSAHLRRKKKCLEYSLSRIKCDVCNKGFKSNIQLEKHKRVQHCPFNKFICTKCKTGFLMYIK